MSTAVALGEALAAELAGARERTLALLAGLSEEQLTRQHDPIMSPIVWDIGHIGQFEELWLPRRIAGRAPVDPRFDDLYDPSRPRHERPELDLPGVAETLDYLALVRAETLAVLSETRLDPSDPLLRDGFVFRMVLQHELQHCETILQTLQLMPGASRLPPSVAALPPGSPAGDGMIAVPAGPFVMGTDDAPGAYDNERPAHIVELGAFEIDRFPVSNRDYAAFLDEGGYENESVWSPEGWVWRTAAGIGSPKHWRRDAGRQWRTSRFGADEPLDPERPAVHVSWYEADAYARWAGKRLPTEAEWEKAASWDPGAEAKRLFPWGAEPATHGRANLDQLAFAAAPVGAYPAGASAYGVEQLLGDVWEWTASEFQPYPGFASFPYREYSEIFFGNEYRVLRGGSFATCPGAIRTTFRNWDFPIRRQIFAGFRCARDR